MVIRLRTASLPPVYGILFARFLTLLMLVGSPWPKRQRNDEFFELRLRPLLAKRCYECHRRRAEAGLRLDSLKRIKEGGQSGPAIVVGDAEKSLLWQVVSGNHDDIEMPPDSPLKTNEITRKKSDFLEGTYAVHGIEEVLEKEDVVLWVEPYEESEEKFRETLCGAKGVGLDIIAVASRETSFPTIQIPSAGDLDEFVQMAAGWSILAEVGLSLGIDLDKPERARKVGNEFVE